MDVAGDPLVRGQAEGIEHPRQLAELREMGCGYGQGFLVARPMAAPGVESLIRTGSIETGGTPGVPGAPGTNTAAAGELGDGTAAGPAVQDVSGAAKPGVPAA